MRSFILLFCIAAGLLFLNACSGDKEIEKLRKNKEEKEQRQNEQWERLQSLNETNSSDSAVFSADNGISVTCKYSSGILLVSSTKGWIFEGSKS